MDRFADYEEEILDWLNNLDDDEMLIEYWNHYSVNCCLELDIYPMSDLEFEIDGMSKLEIIDEFTKSDHFDIFEDWFYQDIHGFHSFDNSTDEECPIDVYDLAHWIDCNHDDYIFEEFVHDKEYHTWLEGSDEDE